MPRAHSGVLPGATVRRRARALAMVVILVLGSISAWAKPVPGPIARAARASVAAHAPKLTRAPAQLSPGRQRHRGPGRVVAGAAVGAVAGFFAGGYLGAAIDGDCGGCDDPGLKGALIGAPVGAVTGGILGGKFLF